MLLGRLGMSSRGAARQAATGQLRRRLRAARYVPLLPAGFAAATTAVGGRPAGGSEAAAAARAGATGRALAAGDTSPTEAAGSSAQHCGCW
jgi:hypothetical protein